MIKRRYFWDGVKFGSMVVAIYLIMHYLFNGMEHFAYVSVFFMSIHFIVSVVQEYIDIKREYRDK